MQQTQTVVVEPPLYFSSQNAHIWKASFHPQQNILACSLITGSIQILQYNSEDVKLVLKNNTIHKGSARWCTFNPSGSLLATCSQDKRLGFIDAQGKVAHIIKKAHTSPINRCQFVDDQMLMSGDDEGEVKLWDLRTTQCIFEAHNQSDAITGLRFDSEYTNILTSCLDGTVAIYDVKKGTQSEQKLYAISDSIDEQLNGLQIVKEGKYLACPSSQNSIVLFKRQNIQNYVDRIQGIPGSVNTILKINENSIVAGSEDGFLRGVGIKPNKLIQTLGQHEQQQNFPIQSLSLSFCRKIIASTSHDNSIQFYDVNQFVKRVNQLKNELQQENQQNQSQEVMSIDHKNKQLMMENDSDQMDYEDDDSDESMSQQKPKKKKKKSGKVSLKSRQKQIKKENTKSFFKGL